MIQNQTKQILTGEDLRAGRILQEGQDEYKVTLPQVTDISAQEGIRLEVELLEDGIAEIEVTLYPLKIGRPEFFPSVSGRAAVWGRGRHFVEIPFEQFAFRQMTRAFLKYLDGISVKLVQGVSIVLKGAAADTMGDFMVQSSETSRAGDTGDWMEYSLLLSNKASGKRVINIRQSLYGMECLPVEYVPYVLLEAGETKEYMVKVKVTEDIPPGGLEKSVLLFVPEGDGAQARRIVLQTSRKREHPYLFLEEGQWKKRREALFSEEALYKVFCREYMEEAEKWIPPEVSQEEDHVYPAYSQNGLFKTAVSWKITGNKEYLKKALRFFQGFLEEEKGYLSTRKSYFVFVEDKKEYARGNFKVCRAQSAGWVQEAEFFNKLAMSYDLLYRQLTPRQHGQMEACLRNYMAFASWRLTDGDGNNFQVAECGAGLLCALVLQDRDEADRFLYGFNGFTDLLSAVLLDDGMYFEEASGYVRLAGELFFDIVNAAENFGISLKELKAPASFDRNILHAPWAMRETWAEDGKPFLGMSFRRFEKFTRSTRCLKDYFDCTARLLTDRGIMFSINDSNEQDFTKLYQKAYYLYRDPLYKRIGALAAAPETLLVPEEQETYGLGESSLLMEGAGFAILREQKKAGGGEGTTQAVLKFGVHGGYHGHFDRLSLASYIRDRRTFHNNEYAWYGYDSFLFKMWVQTSMAHNMTVVDGRVQKPAPCQCVYYAADEKAVGPEGREAFEEPTEVLDTFSAVCAQTETEWMDPPYGGQTPYPYAFPEEKCAREGRFVLKPENPRKQGDIGDFSEPVFQRRLLILFHGYCIVWDYLEGRKEHRYDCLYHPMGGFYNEEDIPFVKRERFLDDPYGAGQFILNCHTAQAEGPLCLRFHNDRSKDNADEIMENMLETVLWRAWPVSGAVTIGRYPQRKDTFSQENRMAAEAYLEEPRKKTVSFSLKAGKAGFITLLEAGETTGRITGIRCDDFQSVFVQEKDGRQWRIAAAGMEDRNGQIRVDITQVF